MYSNYKSIMILERFFLPTFTSNYLWLINVVKKYINIKMSTFGDKLIDVTSLDVCTFI